MGVRRRQSGRQVQGRVLQVEWLDDPPLEFRRVGVSRHLLDDEPEEHEAGVAVALMPWLTGREQRLVADGELHELSRLPHVPELSGEIRPNDMRVVEVVEEPTPVPEQLADRDRPPVGNETGEVLL